MPQSIENSYPKVLIHGDGLVDDWEIKDQCGNTITKTGTYAVYNTGQYKFGKGSIYFGTGGGSTDGTLKITSPELTSLTWECWMYLTDYNASYNTVIGTNGTVSRVLAIDPTGLIRLRMGAGDWRSSTATVTLDAWHHIALTWDGSTYTFYYDGTASGTVSNSTTISAGQYFIGAGVNTYAPKGYVSEIYISENTKYSGSFSVPTQPYRGRKGWY